MAKAKTVYICTSCGANSPKWIGKCPSCGEWNTYQEELIQAKVSVKPKLLKDIETNNYHRIKTRDEELDRVLGGGIVPGSVILVGGQPGIGKSTLMLQIAMQLDVNVLYVSGEESEEQIKLRANRINQDNGKCYIYSETDVTAILRQVEEIQPSMIGWIHQQAV